MAIRIFVGLFIIVHSIRWVVTNTVLIMLAPILPVLKSTLDCFPLMNVVSSSTWGALIIAGGVVLALAAA